MAGDADVVSDYPSSLEESRQQQQQRGEASSPVVPRRPSHRLYSTNTSTSSGSESESDVHEQQLHLLEQQRRQSTRQPIRLGGGATSTPAAAAAAQQEQSHQESTHLQLVPCKVCAASASFAHCLTAKGRNGERHAPRLRVVRGPAPRKRSKAQLLPGQRNLEADGPTGASPLVEDGASEPLPLTPENLVLRYGYRSKCTSNSSCRVGSSVVHVVCREKMKSTVPPLLVFFTGS